MFDFLCTNSDNSSNKPNPSYNGNSYDDYDFGGNSGGGNVNPTTPPKPAIGRFIDNRKANKQAKLAETFSQRLDEEKVYFDKKL